jgi:hypothetical protein
LAVVLATVVAEEGEVGPVVTVVVEDLAALGVGIVAAVVQAAAGKRDIKK